MLQRQSLKQKLALVVTSKSTSMAATGLMAQVAVAFFMYTLLVITQKIEFQLRRLQKSLKKKVMPFLFQMSY